MAAHSGLLRESSRKSELDVDMRVVLGEADDPDGGVERGALLRAFAMAALGKEGDAAATRAALAGAIGAERTGQAARIVASFDGINRVADATGIRLDDPARIAPVIEELRLETFLTE